MDEGKVSHNPILNTNWVADYCSKRDGVPVKYVCTTALDSSATAQDVFYRSTPHPEFGNRYFGMYVSPNTFTYIGNADRIEDLEFGMILDENGMWHYSSHRHDYKSFGKKCIDGGRAYIRGWGFEMFKVKDGKFVEEKAVV